MSNTISRRARHRTVYTFLLHHGQYPHSYSKQAFLAAEDARDAARAKISFLCSRLKLAKSYFTFEVMPLRLVSETKRKAKSKSSGPY